MVIDEKTVDDIQRLVNSNQIGRINPISISGISPGALLEMCFRAREWVENPEMKVIFERWQRENEPLQIIFEEINNPRVEDDLTLNPVDWGFLSLKLDLGNNWRWTCYRQRFKRSLEGHGFSTNLSNALAAAMDEMVENALNHSGPNDEEPAPALVIYHITDGAMTYAVADIGRGILDSLQGAGRGDDLETSHDALEAAIQQKRSRRPDYPIGDGFSRVFRSLVDLNGDLRFRTGDAALQVTGRQDNVSDYRSFDYSQSPSMPGLQLSVHCCPSGNPALKFLH